MAENGGGQELDKLLISVDAELGDLKGIDSAINAMQSLSNFAQNAQKGAGALKVMADALNGIDKFGKTTSGIKKAKSGIDDLVGVLETLSKYTGSAKNSIRELGQLGKALHNFANIGTELKGLDKVVVGINGIIDAMQRLSGLSGSVKETTDAMANLGKSFDFSRDAKSASRSRKELLRELKGMRAVAPKVDTDAFDLSDSVEQGTKATIDAIEKSGEQIAKAKSNIYKNLLSIKNNKDNADFVSFDTMFAPKIIGSNIKNNLKAIKEARKNSGLNAISELGGQLTLGFDKNMDAFVADTKQAVTDFAKMYEYAEKIAKLATYKGGAISGLANRTEQMFFGSSKTGLTSNIATSKEKLHLEKGMMDNLWKEVKKQVDTMLHSHPFDSAAFSPNDIRTGIESSLLKGIDKQLVVGFKEISSFDFSRIQNKSNLDKIVEQFEKNLDKGIHDYYNNTIKFYEEAVAKANGMGKFNTSQIDATGIFRQAVEENIHISLQELFGKTAFKISGMEEQIISDYFKGLNKNNAMFGAAEVGGIADAFANGITEKYKQCNFDFGKIRDTIHDNLGTLLTRLIHEQFGDEKASNTYQTMIKDSLKDALTQFGEKANDIYKSFNINEYIDNLKKGIFLEDAGKDSTNKSIRVFESEADVIEKANRKLENLINKREQVLNRLRQTKEDLDRLDAKAGSRDYDYATQNAVQRYSAEYSKAKQELEKIEKQISDVEATKNSAKWLQSKEFGKDNAEKLSAEFDIEERVIKKYNDRLASLVEKREQILESLKIENDALKKLDAQAGSKDFGYSAQGSVQRHIAEYRKLKSALQDINAEIGEVERVKRNAETLYRGARDPSKYSTVTIEELLKQMSSNNGLNAIQEQLPKNFGNRDANTESLYVSLESYSNDIEQYKNALKKINAEGKEVKEQLAYAKEMRDFLLDFIPSVNNFSGEKLNIKDVQPDSNTETLFSQLNSYERDIEKCSAKLKEIADKKKNIKQSMKEAEEMKDFLEGFIPTVNKFDGLDAIEEKLPSGGYTSMLDKAPKLKGATFNNLQKVADSFGGFTDSLRQLDAFREVIEKFADLPKKLEGLDKTIKSIGGMFELLKKLSEYEGNADSAITQLSSFGKALQKFANLGESLQGLDTIYKGVNKMIDTLVRLAEINGDSRTAIKQLGSLGAVLHTFNGLDDNVAGLNDIALGLINLAKATAMYSGSQESDFEYIKNIASALASVGEKFNSKLYNNIITLSTAWATLVSSMSSGNKVDTSQIETIGTALKDAFKDIEINKVWAISKSLEGFGSTFEAFNNATSDTLYTINTLVAGFENASQGFYTVRQNIEAVTFDFEEALKPIKDSALFDILERFKHLNDSYKNVGGLGQGLGVLINALDMLNGRNLQTGGLTQLLEYFAKLANGTLVDEASAQMEKLGALAQPIASLINALKYTDFTEKNNVLDVLATQLVHFYSVLPENGDKFSFLLYGLRDLINLAKDMSISIPQDNVITQLTTALQGFNNIKDGKAIAGLLEGIKSIGEWLSPSLKADTEEVRSQISVYERSIDSLKEKLFSFKQEQNALLVERDDVDDTTEIDKRLDKLEEGIKSYESMLKKQEEAKLQLERSINGTNIDTSPILAIAQALEKFDSIGKNLENFRSVMNSLKALKNIRVDNLKGLELVLEGVFDALDTIPEGKVDSLKGLASVVRALNNAQSVDPEQLNLVADGLVKILNALNGISGSGNSISIKLDSSGVANFQKVVDKTNNDWDEFSDNLQESLGNIDVEGLFNFDAPLKELQKQLGQAERTYASLQRKILAEQQNVDKYANRLNNPQESSRYRDHVTSLEQAKKAAQDYEAVIRRLREAIDNYSGFDFNNDADALVAIRQMEKEYKNLQKFMEDYKKDAKSADPESTMGQGFEMVGRRMEYLKEQIDLAHEHLKEMPDTIEGIGIRTKDFVNQLRDATAEAKKLNSELGQNIGKGFGEFGSMLSGSGNKVLGSFGNLSSVFGKSVSDGTLKFGEKALQTLSKLAGILGKFAKTVALVGAVVNVVVNIFMAWRNLANKIRQLFAEFIEKLIDFAKTLGTNVVNAFKAVSSAINKVVSLVVRGGKLIGSALHKVGEAGSKIIQIFGNIGKALAPALRGLKSIIGLITPRIVRTLIETNGNLKKIIKNTHLLKGAIKVVTRYFSMFTRMLMRKSITALINEIKQAFQDLAVYEHDAGVEALRFNTNVSKIFSQLRISANQWMGAFEPLINAVTPVILNFLYRVQAMGENVAKFMAILTGQSYYIRAKSFYEDYAESLDKANQSQKNLTNGLDELNILSDKKTDSGILPEDMFEHVPVDGEFILPALNGMIDKIIDFFANIDWEAIRDKIKGFVDWLFEIINNFLQNRELWEQLGRTLAEMLNTVVSFINDIVHDLDWTALGQAIVESLKAFLENIDWELIRDTVETTAKGLADTLNEFFGNKELWIDIGETVAHVINDVIVDYLKTFAWEFDFVAMAEALATALKTALENISWEDIKAAVDGWMQGIVDAINTWANDEQLWKDIGEALGKAIQIMLIGALKKLTEIDLGQVAEAIKTAIKSALEQITWTDVYDTIEEIANDISAAINSILTDEEFLTGLALAVSHLVNAIIELIDETLIQLQSYDIGNAIASALVKGLENIHWNTLFMLPADAINAFSNALRGLLDAIPEDFNLGRWLTDHLTLTLDTINWDSLKDSLDAFGKKIGEWINGLFEDEEFWKKAGVATGKVIDIGVNFILNLFSVNGEDLGKAIANYVNGLISQVNIGSYISKTIDIVLNLVVALDVAIRNVDWSTLGRQIAQGIVDAIDKIFNNIDKIVQLIKDAFAAFNTIFSTVIKRMLEANSFFKLGQIIGNIILAVIEGFASFFEMNGADIVKAIKQFASGLSSFIKKNKKAIVDGLNTIIDGIVAILHAFLDEKGELWKEICDIVKKLHLPDLLGVILKAIIQGIAETFELNSAITASLTEDLKKLADVLWESLSPLFDAFFGELTDKWLKGFKKKHPLLGAIIEALISDKSNARNGVMNWRDWADKSGAEEEGEKAGESWWDKFVNGVKKGAKKVGDFFSGIFGGKKEEEVSVTFEPIVDEEEVDKALDGIKDKTVPVTLETEMGAITASEINVDVINAEVLNLTEIFADVLHVGKIDTATNSATNEMDKFFAGNDDSIGSGSLSKDMTAGTLTVDKIVSELLEVVKMIAEELHIEKMYAQMLNVVEATVDKMKVNKDETKLLKAKKIQTDLLDVIDIIGKTLKVDTIEGELNKDGLNLVNGSDRAVRLGDTSILNVDTINADTLNVNTINANALKVADIVADTLKVGTIEGSLSGGTSSGLGLGSLFGLTSIKRPTFEKGGRWSDISGLIPSAEDFLEGLESSLGTTVKQAEYYADGLTSALGGKLSSTIDNGKLLADSKDTKGTDDIVLPENAKYIKDYLMKAIGNENGVYGLLGNLYAESGLKSNNLQDSGNKKLGMTDEEYTDYINNGGKFADNIGYGLAQWTTSDRKKALLDSLNGRSVDDLDAQLEYLVNELKTNYKGVFETLKNASSIHEASSAVLTGFEKPKDQGTNQDALRWHYGEGISKLLGGEEVEAETHDVEGIKNFDEFNVIGESGELSAYDNVLLQAEYFMAELYNIIDTWLGRLFRLLESFIDELFGDFFDKLEEYEFSLEIISGELLEDINDNLEKLIETLEKLLTEGIECHCDCECGDADTTHLDNNTKAKSANTKAVEENTKAIMELIHNGLGEVTCNCNCGGNCGNCAAGQSTTHDVPQETYWGENTIGGGEDTTPSQTIGDRVADEVINFIDNISDGVTEYINTTPTGGTGSTTYYPTGYTGGTTYYPTGGGGAYAYPTGRGGGYYPPTGRTSYPYNYPTGRGGRSNRNGGSEIVWQNANGTNAPMFANINGQLVRMDEKTLSDTIKDAIARGMYTISDAKGNALTNSDYKKMLDFLRKRGWLLSGSSKGNQGSSQAPDDGNVYLLKNGDYNQIYAMIDGQRVALTHDLDDNLKNLLANGVDELGNKIEYFTDEYGALTSDELLKMFAYLNLEGWKQSDLEAEAILKDKEATEEVGDKVDEVKDELADTNDTLEQLKEDVEGLADSLDKIADEEQKENTENAIESAMINQEKFMAEGDSDADGGNLSNNKDIVVPSTDTPTRGGTSDPYRNDNTSGNGQRGVSNQVVEGGQRGEGGLGSIEAFNDYLNGADWSSTTDVSSNPYYEQAIADAQSGWAQNNGGNGGKGGGTTPDVSTGAIKDAYGNTVGHLDGVWKDENGNKGYWLNGQQVSEDEYKNRNNGGNGGSNGGSGNDGSGNGANNGSGDSGNGTSVRTPNVATGDITDANGNTVGHMNGYWRDSEGNGSYWYNGQKVSEEEYRNQSHQDFLRNYGQQQLANGNMQSDDFVSNYAFSQPDVATGMTNYYDENGNLIASIPTKDVVAKKNEKNAEAIKKAEEERVANEKAKNEEARKKKNESTPIIYQGTDNLVGGVLTDEVKAQREADTKTVEEYRKKAKEFMDIINKNGTDAQKASAENYFNSLNTNKAALNASPYKFNYDKLEDIANQVKVANAFGEDYKNIRVQTNGGIFAIKDLLKTESGKLALADVLDKYEKGKEVRFYKQGNGSSNSANKSDRITDEETVKDLISKIKSLGIEAKSATEETTNKSDTVEKGTDIGSSIDAYIKLFNENAEVLKNVTSADAEKLFKQAGITAGAKVYYADGKKALQVTPWDKVNNYASYMRGKRTIESEAENNGEVTKFSFNNYESSNPASDFENWYKNSFLVRGYQMGGVPNSGEIFVARENGTPEYVGSFGGKTAVANNDQIVTAVANGVSMANDRMVSAIQEQTNALENAINNKDVDVTIGDRQIAEANRRGQQSMGGKFVE